MKKTSRQNYYHISNLQFHQSGLFFAVSRGQTLDIFFFDNEHLLQCDSESGMNCAIRPFSSTSFEYHIASFEWIEMHTNCSYYILSLRARLQESLTSKVLVEIHFPLNAESKAKDTSSAPLYFSKLSAFLSTLSGEQEPSENKTSEDLTEQVKELTEVKAKENFMKESDQPQEMQFLNVYGFDADSQLHQWKIQFPSTGKLKLDQSEPCQAILSKAVRMKVYGKFTAIASINVSKSKTIIIGGTDEGLIYLFDSAKLVRPFIRLLIPPFSSINCFDTKLYDEVFASLKKREARFSVKPQREQVKKNDSVAGYSRQFSTKISQLIVEENTNHLFVVFNSCIAKIYLTETLSRYLSLSDTFDYQKIVKEFSPLSASKSSIATALCVVLESWLLSEFQSRSENQDNSDSLSSSSLGLAQSQLSPETSANSSSFIPSERALPSRSSIALTSSVNIPLSETFLSGPVVLCPSFSTLPSSLGFSSILCVPTTVGIVWSDLASHLCLSCDKQSSEKGKTSLLELFRKMGSSNEVASQRFHKSNEITKITSFSDRSVYNNFAPHNLSFHANEVLSPSSLTQYPSNSSLHLFFSSQFATNLFHIHQAAYQFGEKELAGQLADSMNWLNRRSRRFAGSSEWGEWNANDSHDMEDEEEDEEEEERRGDGHMEGLNDANNFIDGADEDVESVTEDDENGDPDDFDAASEGNDDILGIQRIRASIRRKQRQIMARRSRQNEVTFLVGDLTVRPKEIPRFVSLPSNRIDTADVSKKIVQLPIKFTDLKLGNVDLLEENHSDDEKEESGDEEESEDENYLFEELIEDEDGSVRLLPSSVPGDTSNSSESAASTTSSSATSSLVQAEQISDVITDSLLCFDTKRQQSPGNKEATNATEESDDKESIHKDKEVSKPQAKKSTKQKNSLITSYFQPQKPVKSEQKQTASKNAQKKDKPIAAINFEQMDIFQAMFLFLEAYARNESVKAAKLLNFASPMALFYSFLKHTTAQFSKTSLLKSEEAIMKTSNPQSSPTATSSMSPPRPIILSPSSISSSMTNAPSTSSASSSSLPESFSLQFLSSFHSFPIHLPISYFWPCLHPAFASPTALQLFRDLVNQSLFVYDTLLHCCEQIRTIKSNKNKVSMNNSSLGLSRFRPLSNTTVPSTIDIMPMQPLPPFQRTFFNFPEEAFDFSCPTFIAPHPLIPGVFLVASQNTSQEDSIVLLVQQYLFFLVFMEQRCPNCLEVIAMNFDLHVNFCSRHRTRCDKCGQVMENDKVEIHQNTVHKEVPCPQCDMLIDAYFLEKHKKDECQNRVIGQCPYCNIDLFLDSPPNHVEDCGNRTDICEQCNNRVKLKDMDRHLESGCKEYLSIQPRPIRQGLRLKSSGILSAEDFSFLCPLCQEATFSTRKEAEVHISHECFLKDYLKQWELENGKKAAPLPFTVDAEGERVFVPQDIAKTKVSKENETKTQISRVGRGAGIRRDASRGTSLNQRAAGRRAAVRQNVVGDRITLLSEETGMSTRELLAAKEREKRFFAQRGRNPAPPRQPAPRFAREIEKHGGDLYKSAHRLGVDRAASVPIRARPVRSQNLYVPPATHNIELNRDQKIARASHAAPKTVAKPAAKVIAQPKTRAYYHPPALGDPKKRAVNPKTHSKPAPKIHTIFGT
ncbi:uncharacterized protein MONOS_1547 [Monocercomonoides exilis]|uniref:uncharacterized protein n=1 Tax=Monocercomonoides exilis TaxID=2049356 RepID=UPI003559CD93|nr:hypothetical protein MONOS_1547 [Monocercomonoides exilis]|eukprot:MONOS_1547.1-p1 / transcript=MONOS_1547.1 / gene=MONOS_1547 / organism=Monocercomonoides_exilis_PA203 / gene_product=unspecified product / transcript_product=unspecified product / location=Mono_scaffold00027:200976-207221(+) / protein_length=1646 / sequence_SO=supercontig / SO=protein_coding / is_pseudo=false